MSRPLRRHPGQGMVCLQVVLASMVLLARNVGAAGFQVNEQSARGLGSSFAGEAAAAEDASTIFFNPAGMTRLSGTQFVSAGFAIKPSVNFHNQGSRLNSAVGGGAPREPGRWGQSGGGASPASEFGRYVNLSPDCRSYRLTVIRDMVREQVREAVQGLLGAVGGPKKPANGRRRRRRGRRRGRGRRPGSKTRSREGTG